MSKGLENLVNTSAVTSDYPWKNIKDDSGAQDGTPLDMISHADYHQTFRKMLAEAVITPNNLPDNVTNGYQYIEAMHKVYKRAIGVKNIAGNTTLVQADRNKVINCLGAGGYNVNLMSSTVLLDGESVIVFNNSSGQIVIQAGGADGINGGPDLTLMQPGDFAELFLFKGFLDWVPAMFKITPFPYVVPVLTVGGGGSNPAFQNSWGQIQPVKIRLDHNGLVSIEGLASKGFNGSGVIFTLPAGFRPPVPREVPVMQVYLGSQVMDTLHIDTNGDCQLNNPTANTTQIYFTTIFFWT